MADYTLKAKITGDATKLISATKQAKTAISEMTKNISKSLQSAGMKMTAGVTAPMLALGGVAVKTSADFEHAMKKVQAISGATGKDYEKLSKFAREMGATTKFSATESAEAMKYMGMAGWKSEQMIEGLPGILNLAAASGEDLATTSDIVTDALTAFGMKAEKAGDFADLLASATTNSNTTVSMLGESFKYVAPLAGTLGYKAEDTALALGLMANSGIKASTAGTALRRALSNMIKPTKSMKSAMEDLGISMTDKKGEMKPLKVVLDDLRKSFQGLSKEEQAQYASTIFGKQAMAGMLAVINSSTEDYEKLTEATNSYSGQAQKMADTMNSSLTGQFTILKSALTELALQIGDIILPKIKQFVEYIQDLVKKLQELSPETKTQILNFTLIAVAIGPVLLAFGKIIELISSLINVFGIISSLFTTIAPLITTAFSPIAVTIVGVISGISLLIYTIQDLWNTSDGFRQAVIEIWNNISDSLKKVYYNILKPIFDGFIELITLVIDKAIKPLYENFKKNFEKIAISTSEMLKKVKPIFDTIIEILGVIVPPVIEGLKTNFYSAFKGISNVLEIFFDTVSSVFDGVMKAIGGIADFISGVFTGNWGKAWSGVISVFEGIFGGIVAIAKAPINSIIGLINGFISGLNNIKIPDWVPGVGGKGIHISSIPYLAKGTTNFEGGFARINEGGRGELVTLPSGTTVIPHDISMEYARQSARLNNQTSQVVSNKNISVSVNLDNMNINDNRDIEDIAKELGTLISREVSYAL